MDVKEKKMEENFKYHIPEDIPANERTAFHGAAAAAAKAGKKNFNFGGKTHPVTMKKDLANKIADQKEALDKKDVKTVKGVIKGLKKAVATHSGQVKTLTKDIKDDVKKESTMTFREKLLSLYEGDRKAHYKGATEPEGMHDKSKSSKGAMDMINTPKEVAADGKKVNDDNAAKAAEKKMGRAKKRSGGDNVSSGDQKIVPGGTPVKEPSMAKESAGIFGENKVTKSLIDAVNEVASEASIKGSGTDRKAVLKKAFRAGEKQDQARGSKPAIRAPKGMKGRTSRGSMDAFSAKHKDKGIEKAYQAGFAGDHSGNAPAKGKERMKPSSNLPLNKFQRQGIKMRRKEQGK